MSLLFHSPQHVVRTPARLHSVVVALLLLPCGVKAVQSPVGPDSGDSTRSQVSVLLAQADGAVRDFDNKRALALYSEALAMESGNADILWRISRSFVDIGEHLPSATDAEKQKQLEMYEHALEIAGESVAADDKNSMAYTYHAIALSRVALFKGFWEYVGILKDIKVDLEKAIALDSTNHLAYYSLGMACLKAAERPWIFRWPMGIGWANTARALKNLEKAASLRQDMIRYQLASARALVEEGDYPSARVRLLQIPLLRTRDENDEQYRREARELLDRIKDEE